MPEVQRPTPQPKTDDRQVALRTTQKQTRRCAPKTKLGCLTCKKRHLRCDQTKPSCLRCVRHNWPCEYRNENLLSVSTTTTQSPPEILRNLLPKATVLDHNDRPDNSIRGLTLGPSPVSFLSLTDTTEERRAADFYMHRTGPGFCGQWGSGIWDIMFPRIALSVSAVHHGMLALASLHEDDLKPDSNSANHYFFLKQYNEAIDSLKIRQAHDRTGLQITLMTCILFTYIEFMRGNIDAAETHFHSGRELLRSYNKQYAETHKQELSSHIWSETRAVDNILIQFFNTSVIASVIANYFLIGTAAQPEHFVPPPDEQHFETFAEAQLGIGRIFCQASPQTFALQAPLVDPQVVGDGSGNKIPTTESIATWRAKLEKYVSEYLFDPTVEEIRDLRLLRIQGIIVSIWASKPNITDDPDRDPLDAHVRLYEDILSMSREIVDDMEFLNTAGMKANAMTSDATKRTTGAPILPWSAGTAFAWNSSVMLVLFYVACKCRCPISRREAVALLLRIKPRWDGLRDSRAFATVAQSVIDFEEQKCRLTITRDPSTWPKLSERIREICLVPSLDRHQGTQAVWFRWKPNGENTPYQNFKETIKYEKRIVLDEYGRGHVNFKALDLPTFLSSGRGDDKSLSRTPHVSMTIDDINLNWRC